MHYCTALWCFRQLYIQKTSSSELFMTIIYLWKYGSKFHNILKSIHWFSIQIVFTLPHALTWDHNITKAVQQRVNIHEKSYSKRQQELISESPSGRIIFISVLIFRSSPVGQLTSDWSMIRTRRIRHNHADSSSIFQTIPRN